MKSIRKTITISLMAMVLAALALVGASSLWLNYRSTVATVRQLMSETAVLAAERVEQELTAYKNVAMDTGRVAQLADDEVPPFGKTRDHRRARENAWLPAREHHRRGRHQHF